VSHGERTYDRDEESFPRSERANRDAQIAVIVRAWPAADKSGEIASNGFICVNFHRDPRIVDRRQRRSTMPVIPLLFAERQVSGIAVDVDDSSVIDGRLARCRSRET